MSGAPELDPIALSSEHQARVDASKAQTDASHLAGMERVMADALAGARRLTSEANMQTALDDLWGEFCANCEERWALPAHKATCAHKPICEDCWPNGCGDCEREVEEGIRRRETATHRILSAALELRTGADDLSEADLRKLNWIARKDVLRHTALAIESMRRVEDLLRAQERTTP